MLTDQLFDSWDAIYHLERDISQFQQYSRRENLEIIGLPEKFDDYLEGNVIKILHKIGCSYIEPWEIVGCHRLKKTKSNKDKNQPANVIVRVVNRKHAHTCLRNRKQLRMMVPEIPDLFIIENLCPKYRSIYDDATI